MIDVYVLQFPLSIPSVSDARSRWQLTTSAQCRDRALDYGGGFGLRTRCSRSMIDFRATHLMLTLRTPHSTFGARAARSPLLRCS